ncbi:class IV adenylate cyclase [Leptothrix sp. BB-4]
MARNIEIKARLTSLAEIEPKVAAVATEGPVVLLQDDTFFACANGRLKLRAFGADADGKTPPADLIFYRRADAAGPRASHYRISACPDADGMRVLLAEAHGQTGRVRKRRVLYLVGRTRVHLDEVEGLGAYLELEVVMRDGEPAEAGLDEARALMAQLGIAPAQLESRAYVDLLAERQAAGDWRLELADSELAFDRAGRGWRVAAAVGGRGAGAVRRTARRGCRDRTRAGRDLALRRGRRAECRHARRLDAGPHPPRPRHHRRQCRHRGTPLPRPHCRAAGGGTSAGTWRGAPLASGRAHGVAGERRAKAGCARLLNKVSQKRPDSDAGQSGSTCDSPLQGDWTNLSGVFLRARSPRPNPVCARPRKTLHAPARIGGRATLAGHHAGPRCPG